MAFKTVINIALQKETGRFINSRFELPQVLFIPQRKLQQVKTHKYFKQSVKYKFCKMSEKNVYCH